MEFGNINWTVEITSWDATIAELVDSHDEYKKATENSFEVWSALDPAERLEFTNRVKEQIDDLKGSVENWLPYSIIIPDEDMERDSVAGLTFNLVMANLKEQVDDEEVDGEL